MRRGEKKIKKKCAAVFKLGKKKPRVRLREAFGASRDLCGTSQNQPKELAERNIRRTESPTSSRVKSLVQGD